MRQQNLRPNTCLLLVNIGSPQSPSKPEVKSFLKKLLGDKNVIELPHLYRKFLVNCVIIPFRLKKSIELYKQLFRQTTTSPLLRFSKNLQLQINKQLPQDTFAEIAMLYSPPYLNKVMQKLAEMQLEKIIFLPMYPQYAQSTSGAAIEKFQSSIKKFKKKPKVRLIKSFFDHPSWIDAVANRFKSLCTSSYDSYIFSYHSLPIRQIQRIHPDKCVQNCGCEIAFHRQDTLCYKAACYQTTRLLIGKLNLPNAICYTGFQSKFGKKWLEPNTDDLVLKLANKGKKKLLIFAPSFTIDCLETYVELGITYRTLFLNNGGKTLDVVPCPNDSTDWAKGIIKIAKL